MRGTDFARVEVPLIQHIIGMIIVISLFGLFTGFLVWSSTKEQSKEGIYSSCVIDMAHMGHKAEEIEKICKLLVDSRK